MAFEVRRVITCAHEEQILCVAYNLNKKELYSGAQDGLIKVWDIDSGKAVRTQDGHTGWINDLNFSSATRLLFSASLDGTIRVWSERGRQLQVVEFSGPVFALAWNSKRRHLIAGGNGLVQVYRAIRPDAEGMKKAQEGKGEVKILKPVNSHRSHTDLVRAVCCAENGKVFTAGFDRTVCISDSERVKETCQPIKNAHAGAICTACLDTNNGWLLTGGFDGKVKLWSSEGHSVDVLDVSLEAVTGIAYVPHTKSYWITGKSQRMMVYDPRIPLDMTPYVESTSRFLDYPVQKVCHPPGTDLVLGVGFQKQLVVWRYNPFGAHRVMKGGFDSIECMVAVKRNIGRSLEGSRNQGLVSTSLPTEANGTQSKNEPVVWFGERVSDGISGEAARGSFGTDFGRRTSSGGQASTSGSVGYRGTVSTQGSFTRSAPQGKEAHSIQIYTAGTEGRIFKWTPGNELTTDVYAIDNDDLRGHEGPILCIAYDSDADLLITGSEDKTIRLWQLDSSVCAEDLQQADQERRQSEAPATAAASAAASAAPRRSLRSGADLSEPLTGHTDRVVALACCRDKIVASVSHDRSLRFWDIHKRVQIGCVEDAHEGTICDVAYSEERDEVATAGADCAIKIWCAVTRALKRVISGHTGDVTHVRWTSLRGGMWVTASEDGTIRTWLPDDGKCRSARSYKGEPITAMLVDEHTGVILAATFGKAINCYDMDLNDVHKPYTGCKDVVRALAHVDERGIYLSASQDKCLRAWLAPSRKAAAAPASAQPEEGRKRSDTLFVIEEQVAALEEGHTPNVQQIEEAAARDSFSSAYARAHPLTVPRSLRGKEQWGPGLTREAGVAKKAGRRLTVDAAAAAAPDDPSVPPVTHAHLAGKLRELEENLQSAFYNPSDIPVRRSKGPTASLARTSNSRVNSRLGHGGNSSPKR